MPNYFKFVPQNNTGFEIWMYTHNMEIAKYFYLVLQKLYLRLYYLKNDSNINFRNTKEWILGDAI